MRQTITIRRVETRTIQLDVPQALTVETLTRLANEALAGVGAPSFGTTTAHQLTDWSVSKAEPSCECARQPKRSARRRS